MDINFKETFDKLKELLDKTSNELKDFADDTGDKLKGFAEKAGILNVKPELSSPQRGDIIFAARNVKLFKGKIILKNLYYHYGVYVGDNKVIHFSDPNPNETTKSHATIIETSFEDFADGDVVFIEPIDENIKHNNLEKTAVKAEFYLYNHKDKYNLGFNNCEHFANICRYNKKKSSQVSKFLKILLPSIIMNLPKVLPLHPAIKIPTSLIAFVLEHFLSNKGKLADKSVVKNPTKIFGRDKTKE